MKSKLFSLLGFATKAGKLSFGFEAVVSALKAGKSHLVLAAEDISDKTYKEVSYFANQNAIPVVRLKGIDILSVSAAVGRKCGIISVNDSGFALALKAYDEGGIANDQ